MTVSEIVHTGEGQRHEGDHLFPLFCCPLLLSTFGRIAESTVSSHLPNSCKKPESKLVASTNATEPARDATRFFHRAFFSQISYLNKSYYNSLFSAYFNFRYTSKTGS